MLNGFDPLAPRFLADLERIQERTAKAERQLSSGLRVEKASDDPEHIMEILRLQSRLQANTQVQTNLTRIKSRVDTAEAAVRQSVEILERARVLAAQTATTGAENRPGIAIEARQLHERLLALVNTTAEGQAVFTADGQGPSYVGDWSQPGGVQFTGTSRTNTNLVVDENNTRFSVSKTASELFDARNPDNTSATGNAFEALHELTIALENDDEAAVQAAMPRILASLDHLNQNLTFHGNAQTRVTAALEAAQKNAVALKTTLSNRQDADLTAVILELNSASLHHQTALAAHARTPKSTLFDFIG